MFDDFFVSSGEFELNGWGFSLAALFFRLASQPEGYNENKSSYISSYCENTAYHLVYSEKISHKISQVYF